MRYPLSILLGLVTIGALLAFDAWLFNRWLHISHWRWYLQNGSSIALMTSLAGIAWGDLEKPWGDLEKHTRIISAHPMEYVSACMLLVAVPMFAMGTLMRRSPATGSERGSLLDSLLTTLVMLVLMVLLTAWVVMVMPLQYPLVMVCGAPARSFSHAGLRADVVILPNGEVQLVEATKDEPPRRGARRTGLTDKPFTLTNLLIALLLFVSKMLVG